MIQATELVYLSVFTTLDVGDPMLSAVAGVL